MNILSENVNIAYIVLKIPSNYFSTYLGPKARHMSELFCFFRAN